MGASLALPGPSATLVLGWMSRTPCRLMAMRMMSGWEGSEVCWGGRASQRSQPLLETHACIRALPDLAVALPVACLQEKLRLPGPELCGA